MGKDREGLLINRGAMADGRRGVCPCTSGVIRDPGVHSDGELQRSQGQSVSSPQAVQS